MNLVTKTEWRWSWTNSFNCFIQQQLTFPYYSFVHYVEEKLLQWRQRWVVWLQSEQFRETVYSCRWEDQNQEFKRTLLLLLLRTRTPVTVAATELFQATLANYYKVYFLVHKTRLVQKPLVKLYVFWNTWWQVVLLLLST